MNILGIPAGILPKIISNSEIIGKVGKGWPTAGIPIAGCLGGQHSAMLGQASRKDEAKSTYWSGAFILLNTGEEIVKSKHGLLTTLAYKHGPKAPTNYALEGSIAIAGAAVQWLRYGLGIISSASEIEELAGNVDSNDGVYFFLLLMDCLLHGGAMMLMGFVLGSQGLRGRLTLQELCLKACFFKTCIGFNAQRCRGKV